MAKKCRLIYLFDLFIFDVFHSYEERREEEAEKVKHKENSQNCLFGTYIEKNQHIHFLMYVHFSWSTSSFT